MMQSRRILVAALLLAGACRYSAPDIARVPDYPTYENDVRPLLADHCLLCHGHPPNRGAPSYFRLDVYDETDGVMGAEAWGESILGVVAGNTMPPGTADGEGVGPNGKKMLELWVANGKPR